MRGAAVACLAAAGVLVAGCGGGGSSSSSTTGATPSGLAVSAPTCTSVADGGTGTPDALIVSDLPMQGDSAERSAQQVDAIKLALDQAGWKAGSLNVGFQACDDSIAKTGLWDPKTCTSNAHAYAADPKLLGV